MPCTATATDCYGGTFNAGVASWSSSDTSVMTVDGYGNIHGVSTGQATITANFDSVPTYTGVVCYYPCPTGSPQVSAAATVLSATMSQNTSGPVSGDDTAASNYQTATGTTTLGPFTNISAFHGCGIGFETVGTISPSNYTGNVIIHRTNVNQGLYVNSTDAGGEKPPNSDDTSSPSYQDQNPQPSGNV